MIGQVVHFYHPTYIFTWQHTTYNLYSMHNPERH